LDWAAVVERSKVGNDVILCGLDDWFDCVDLMGVCFDVLSGDAFLDEEGLDGEKALVLEHMVFRLVSS
jgi:hypothetical protein